MDSGILALPKAPRMSSPADNQALSPLVEVAPATFEAFYHERLDRTVRQVSLMVGSTAVAEDLAHDAMAEVLKRWGSLDNPGGYLYRCASNAALRWLRRNRRHQAPANVVELGTTSPSTDFVEMADLLDRLTPKQRVAVVLRYYEDLTEDQIARAMRCRPGTVGPLLARAHAALRRELSE